MARLCATHIGVRGKVVGLDINPGMVAAARSLPPVPGVSFEWVKGSAVAMPLPDAAFELVLCQQGLQFFPDRPAALREMRRVLVLGGAVGGECLARAPFSLPDAEELRSLIARAGFRDVTIHSASKTLRFPSPEEFVQQYVSGSPLAGPVAQVSGVARSALLEDMRKGLRQYQTVDSVAFPIEAHLVTART